MDSTVLLKVVEVDLLGVYLLMRARRISGIVLPMLGPRDNMHQVHQLEPRLLRGMVEVEMEVALGQRKMMIGKSGRWGYEREYG